MMPAKSLIASLTTIAKQINSLNAGVVEQMVQSGKLLVQAKTQLEKETGRKRGGFQDWVRANLKITPQTASRYMRLALAQNPVNLYAGQKAGRKKVAKKKERLHTEAPLWGQMAPLNRAKAAFNGLTSEDRQEFLKWVTEQLDLEAKEPTPEPPPRRVRHTRAMGAGA